MQSSKYLVVHAWYKDRPYLTDKNTGSHGNSEVHECVLHFHNSLIWPNLSSGSGVKGQA